MDSEMLTDSSNPTSGSRKRRRRGAKGRENSRQHNKITQEITIDLSSKLEEEKQLQLLSSAAKNDGSGKNIGSAKKKRKKRVSVPKPGEEGYLSKTQLRNARKRRSKQKKRSADIEVVKISTKSGGEASINQSISSKSNGKSTHNELIIDPSTKYLSKPLSCPLVTRAKQFFTNLEVPFQTYLGQTTGWRTVSKLPVRSQGTENKCMIGLFIPHSHKIISVPDSPVHHSSINAAIKNLEKLCNELKIEPFKESDGSGFLRYICINVDRSSKTVQITLVWNSPPPEDDECSPRSQKNHGQNQLDTLLKSLTSQKDSLKIHSLWVHYNAKWKHADGVFDFGTPSTFSSLWKHVFGPQYIVEKIDIPNLSEGKIKLHFQPNVFRQANLDAFTKIVIAIRKYITNYNNTEKKDTLPSCLELYGGVGTLGLSLYDITSNLLCSDENPFNMGCFFKSVELLSSKAQKRISYLSKNATSVTEDRNNLPLKNNAEIVIVDPPRKGLDEYVLKSLTHEKGKNQSCIFNETKLLVYVSCGFDAFETDCNTLLKSKKWVLDHAEGHVLFPGSNAIETLAFFKTNS